MKSAILKSAITWVTVLAFAASNTGSADVLLGFGPAGPRGVLFPPRNLLIPTPKPSQRPNPAATNPAPTAQSFPARRAPATRWLDKIESVAETGLFRSADFFAALNAALASAFANAEDVYSYMTTPTLETASASRPSENMPVEPKAAPSPAPDADAEVAAYNASLAAINAIQANRLEQERKKRMEEEAAAAAAALAQRQAAAAQARAVAVQPQMWTLISRSFNPSALMGHRWTVVYALPDGTTRTICSSPLVFDLSGRGIGTLGSTVAFDIAGNGKPALINDLPQGVGLLVFDSNHSGIPGKSGLELFGDRTDLYGRGKPTGFKDGFEALNAFVHKAAAEGVLQQRVLARKRLDSGDLERLEKAYGLKMKIGGLRGKAVSLREAGVAAILLSGKPAERARNFDGRSNDLSTQQGAVFIRVNGAAGNYADIWFRYQKTDVHIHPIAGAARPELLRTVIPAETGIHNPVR